MTVYEIPQIDVIELTESDVIRTSPEEESGYDIGMDVPAVKDEDWVIGP